MLFGRASAAYVLKEGICEITGSLQGLQIEMRMMPLELEAKRRCVEYLVNVRRMRDSRLVNYTVAGAAIFVTRKASLNVHNYIMVYPVDLIFARMIVMTSSCHLMFRFNRLHNLLL